MIHTFKISKTNISDRPKLSSRFSDSNHNLLYTKVNHHWYLKTTRADKIEWKTTGTLFYSAPAHWQNHCATKTSKSSFTETKTSRWLTVSQVVHVLLSTHTSRVVARYWEREFWYFNISTPIIGQPLFNKYTCPWIQLTYIISVVSLMVLANLTIAVCESALIQHKCVPKSINTLLGYYKL